jgi:two-component system sensor histidine kinase/response regulator
MVSTFKDDGMYFGQISNKSITAWLSRQISQCRHRSPLHRHGLVLGVRGLFVLCLVLSSQVFSAENILPVPLSEIESQWIKNHPVIKVGADQNWPPFDYADEQGLHQGIASDYLTLLSEILGIRFHVTADKWDNVINGVKGGGLDMLACASNTEERREYLLFTEPYIEIDTVIVVRKEQQEKVVVLDDLDGKTIAVPKGTYIYEMLTNKFPNIHLNIVRSNEEALKALSIGEADAYVGNLAVASHFIEVNLLTNLQIVSRLENEQAVLGIAVRKDWPVLHTILQKGLDAITAEQHKEIRRRWIQPPQSQKIDQVPQIGLTESEQQWLQKIDKIRLGVDPAWPPIEFFDKNKKYKGIAADYVARVSKNIDVEMFANPQLSWDEALERAKSGEIDVFPAIARTAQRDAYLLFTEPYLHFPSLVYMRDDAGLITGLEDLTNKNIAVEKNYANHEILVENHPDINLIVVDSTYEALMAVSTGSADAYMGNVATAGNIIERYGLTNLKVVAPTPYALELAFAVRKDWPELVNILEKAIAAIPAVERKGISNAWFSIRYEHGIDYALIWKIATTAIVFYIIGFTWFWFIRRQRKALKISEERFQLAMHAAQEGLWDWNILNDSVYYSPGYWAMLGYEPGEKKENHASWISLLHPDDKIAALEFVDRAISQREKHYEHEFRLRHKQGHYIDVLSVGSICDQSPDGKAIRSVGTQVDITERKKNELLLKEAKLEAEKASRFKSDFLANMSHDIRTPMNAIVGLGHLALQTKLDEKQRDYLLKINSASDTLLMLVNDILDFSKIEAGKLLIEKIPFKLDDVLENISNLFQSKLNEKNIELIFKVDKNVPPMLVGDALRLGQILTNLVSNAFKFTQAGEVVISIKMQALDENEVKLGFSVRDTGIGIEAKQQERLFESFYQVKHSISRQSTGTGLGLAICKNLVELMGGDIEVESIVDIGTNFRFTVLFEVAQEDSPTFSALYPDLSGRSVLVVDDNATTRSALQEMLVSLSFVVDVAGTIAEAEDVLSSKGNDYDLVLVDWSMPGMGEDFITKLKDGNWRDGQFKAIMMTTEKERTDLLNAATSIAKDSVLIKPVNPSALFDAIVLAMCEGDSRRATEALPSPSMQKLQGHILAVEDNVINQQVIKELLEGYGLSVEIAGDGNDALYKIGKQTFDLVLMDIQLPDMDGLEVTRRIRSQDTLSEIPIIAMTAHALVGDREKSLQAGMNDHVTKPINPSALYRTLASWLALGSDSSVSSLASPDTELGLFYGFENVIDAEDGLSRVGGNPKLYKKLLKEFYKDHAQDLELIYQCRANESQKNAQRLLHTLKGVAGTIGAGSLEEQADALEQKLCDANASDLDFEVFAKEFKALMEVLSTL